MLRDRKLASRFKFFWMVKVSSPRSRSCGVPGDLFLESGGPITFDSRSGVNFLSQVFLACFGVFSDRLRIDQWWKLDWFEISAKLRC